MMYYTKKSMKTDLSLRGSLIDLHNIYNAHNAVEDLQSESFDPEMCLQHAVRSSRCKYACFPGNDVLVVSPAPLKTQENKRGGAPVVPPESSQN